MSKKSAAQQITPAAAMKQVERDAYAAFKEWPIWLHLRLKEIERHLTVTTKNVAAPSATPAAVPLLPAAPVSAPSQRPAKKKAILAQLGKGHPLTASSERSVLNQPPVAVLPQKAPTPVTSELPKPPVLVISETTEAAVLDFLDSFETKGSQS